jgi:hypothetical protein
LAALPADVPVAEARTHWNLRDEPTPVLDSALRHAAYLYLGSWDEEHESDEPQSAKCPARRVFDWLFLRSTIDGYRVPVLDHSLMTELLDAFKSRPDDLPAEAADPDELRVFLEQHIGQGVLCEEDPPESEAIQTDEVN